MFGTLPKTSRGGLSVLYVWGIFVFLVAPASASPLPLALSPTRFEFGAYPGQEVSGVLEFWNGTDSGLPISVELADFEPQDEAGHVTVSGGREDASRSIRSWFRAPFPTLTVMPKESIKLDFSLLIPAAARPGTYWGTVVVRAAPGAGRQGSAIEAALGAIVLVDVYGDVEEKLAIESFSAPSFSGALPVTIAARFRNDGTVHLKPAGYVEIRNMWGRPVARLNLPERNVLPGYARKVELQASEGVRIGPYTAALEATYGTEGRFTAETRFWVVPWKRYGPTVLVFAGLLAFVAWKHKNFRAAFRSMR